MAKYSLNVSNDGYGETLIISATDDEDALQQTEERCEEWIRDGEWGDEGAVVRAYWSLMNDDTCEEIGEGHIDVEIEPNHRALVVRAGGDPDCDHQWTSEGEGGLDNNPGVWSLGGTTMRYDSHCSVCGLHRTEICYGSQRNPGQADRVIYEVPQEI